MGERNVNEVQESSQMISVRLPSYLYETLKVFAKKNGFSMSYMINMAIRSYMRNWKDDVEEKQTAQSKTWLSGWPKKKKCPAPECPKTHDPMEHGVNTRGGGWVRQAYDEAGIAYTDIQE